jgi:arylsulfatase A-like enzyme
MDVYPTVLDVIGAPVPSVINAQSLLPALSGTAPDRPNVGFNHGGMQYYRDGEHKLIYVHLSEKSPFHRPELYRLATDPAENTNVAGDAAARAAEVRDAMWRFVERTTVGHEQAGAVDQDQLELLRQMGYVE